MFILALFDKTAGKFGNPFVADSVAVAERDFGIACNEPKSPMAMFPDDISLKLIGEFDERTGIIKPTTINEITNARKFIKKEPVKNGKRTN